MILLLVSLANAGCSSNLTPPFTEYNIAHAIEKMTEREGRIFGAAINGYSYEAVARYFGITVEQVVEIVKKGAAIVWEMK